MAGRLVDFEPAAGLVTVHPRHANVEQDDIGVGGSANGQASLARSGGQHVIALSAEKTGNEKQGVRIVVNGKNYPPAHGIASAYPVAAKPYVRLRRRRDRSYWHWQAASSMK